MTTITSNVFTITISSDKYSIVITGPTSGMVNQPVTLTVTVMDTTTSSPVSDLNVILTDRSTGTSSTSTTDPSGQATFNLTFSTPGDYSFIATATVP